MKDGGLIVVEGATGSGKTTLINLLLRAKPQETVYAKALGNPETWLGRLARHFPSTWLFLLELLILNWRVVRPSIKAGKIVLHDRYWQSIMAYPTAERFYNQLLWIFLCPFFLKPRKIILCQTELNETLNRLHQKKSSPFHERMIANPCFLRDERIGIACLCHDAKVVDTTKKPAEKCRDELLTFIFNGGGT